MIFEDLREKGDGMDSRDWWLGFGYFGDRGFIPYNSSFSCLLLAMLAVLPGGH